MTAPRDETSPPLVELGSYHVRHAGPTAARAAADIAGLLESGVTLVDLSRHDRHADVVTLLATTGGRASTDDA